MEAVLREAQALLDYWDVLAKSLMFFGFGLVALGVFCSAAIAVYAESMSSNWIKTLAFVATVSSGLLAAFHPVDVGSAYRQAYRDVSSAKRLLTSKQNEANRDNLLHAMDEAEKILRASQERVIFGLGSVYGEAKPGAPK